MLLGRVVMNVLAFQTRKNQFFICLELALDTTKK